MSVLGISLISNKSDIARVIENSSKIDDNGFPKSASTTPINFLASQNISDDEFLFDYNTPQKSIVEMNGDIYTFDAGFNKNFTITKYNTSLDLVWISTWGDAESSFQSGEIFTDGDYLYTCGSEYTNDNSDEMVLIKWSSEGNIIWEKSLGGDGDDVYTRGWGNSSHIFTIGTFNRTYSSSTSIITSWDPITGNILWNSTLTLESSPSWLTALYIEGAFIYTGGYYQNFSSEIQYSFTTKNYVCNGTEIWCQAYTNKYHNLFYIEDLYVSDDYLLTLENIDDMEGSFQSIIRGINLTSGLSEWYYTLGQDETEIFAYRWQTVNNLLYICGNSEYMDPNTEIWVNQILIVVFTLDGMFITNSTYIDQNERSGCEGFDILVYNDQVITTGSHEFYNYEYYTYDPMMLLWDANYLTPASPELITPTQTTSNSSFTIEWTISYGAFLYRIYVNQIEVGTSETLTYELEFMENGTYTIEVRAENPGGVSPKESVLITAELPPSINYPSAPVLLTLNQTINSSNFTLVWNAVPEVIEYRIYLNDGLIANTTATSYSLVDLVNGTYHYSITSWNASGESLIASTITLIVLISPDEIPTGPSKLLIVGSSLAATTAGVSIGVAATPQRTGVLRKKMKDLLKGNKSQNVTSGDVLPKQGMENPIKSTSDSLKSLNMSDQIDKLSGFKDSLSSGFVPGTNLSYQDLISRITDMWDRIPADQRKMLSKLVDKYMRFADQATLATLTGFSALSTQLFEANKIYRNGEIDTALNQLKTVKKEAETAEFIPIVQDADATYTSIAINKGIAEEPSKNSLEEK